MSAYPATPIPCRVVLIGRTGLEAELRHDPGLELARARTPLDAIGEFAEITQPGDTRAAAVLVPANLVPDDQAETFVNALHRIDPHVRVVALGEANGSADIFDVVLPARPDAAALQELLHTHPAPAQTAPAPVAPKPVVVVRDQYQSRAAPAPRAAPVPVAEPIAAAPAAAPVQAAPIQSSSSPIVPGNVPAPLGAMLAGKDPVAAALDELSAKVGVPCTFSPGEAQTFADAAACIRVSHAGRMLGWIRAPGADRIIVEREAQTLAGWIVLSAQQDQLRRAAFTDELTGAFNRRYFNRFLAAAMDHARERRHTVTLLVFDIDNFKTYNDRYLHSAGDEILTETVRLLTSVIRPSDRVCRVGGDEFAVIFHDPEGPRNPAAPATPRTIAEIAARFQKQICEHRFPKLLDQAAGTLTISGGLAAFPWDGATPQELLARADELAMQSKRQGKNHITFGPGAAKVCNL